MRPVEPEEYDDDEYEYEDDDDRPSAHRGAGKRNLSRRGLLVGLSLVAVGGTGVAAYELAPKIPQAVNTVGTNIEHQLQEAFNKGLQQGADNVRKEFVTALESLEGFSLQGAIDAAKLTRVAYDTFVSPIISFGATLTGDFLTAMLRAVQTARGLLAQSFQDNPTLIAIQKVLQSWVDQVSHMPKQLDAITNADLDGAQAYLRALQRKLDEEKAKLNNTNQNVTPAAKPTPKPKH
jgi:predicted PurR-regulated permease PerM